jgi:hypothetical protein
MIAAARRQNYGAAALVPGPRRLPSMVDFCVYLFYRAALGVITALPLRFVFSLGEIFGFLAGWPAGMWKLLSGRRSPRPKRAGLCAAIFGGSAPIYSAG